MPLHIQGDPSTGLYSKLKQDMKAKTLEVILLKERHTASEEIKPDFVSNKNWQDWLKKDRKNCPTIIKKEWQDFVSIQVRSSQCCMHLFFTEYSQTSVEISLPQMSSQNKKARTYEEFKAENNEKTSSTCYFLGWRIWKWTGRRALGSSLFSCLVFEFIHQQQATKLVFTTQQHCIPWKLVDTDENKSLSSKKVSCQQTLEMVVQLVGEGQGWNYSKVVA